MSISVCKVSLYRFLWWWAPAAPMYVFSHLLLAAIEKKHGGLLKKVMALYLISFIDFLSSSLNQGKTRQMQIFRARFIQGHNQVISFLISHFFGGTAWWIWDGSKFHSIKPKLNIRLFVDLAEFPCFYQFLHDVIMKLFCRTKQFYVHVMQELVKTGKFS